MAVACVVLFHLERHALPGGYLGVDMFFVLSGYLITAIIHREAQGEGFSLRRFYERRIRRILPALLLLLAIATGAACLLLLPADLVGYARSLLATLVFGANFYFWRDTDYFSPAAEQKPLLHIWSLGIEEQFYILFPLLLVLLARLLPRALFAAVVGLALLSLAVNILAQRIGATLPAFFLLPARAWELGAGCALALAPASAAPRGTVALLLAYAGLALVIFGMGWPPEHSVNVPPALPVVAGTLLLLLAGDTTQTLPTRLLRLGPVVFLGLISYSLYLWHWPIIVFGQYFLVRPFTAAEAVLAAALMLAAAALSWRFIERPFRSRRLPIRRICQVLGVAMLGLAAAGVAVLRAHGLPGRFSPQASALNEAVGTNYRCGISDYLAFGASRGCVLNLPSRRAADAEVVLLGNSHAQMYAPVWRALLQERGLQGLLVPVNGCLPSVTVNISSDCARTARANLEAVLALPRARTVILAMNWSHAALVDPAGRPLDNRDNQALLAGLDALIGVLRAAGRRVILIGPIDEPGWDVPSTLAREQAFGWPESHPTSQARAQFDARFGGAIAHFAQRSDVYLLRPDLVQCPDSRCYYVMGGRSLFADSNHLAEAELPRFREAFASALPARGS